MNTYSQLRNALFHNGKLEADIKYGNNDIKHVKLIDYYDKLYRLVMLLILKFVGLNTNRIDWNGWISGYILK